MTGNAIQILNDELKEAQARLNKIEADTAETIEAGDRAQRIVTTQAAIVTDICEAIDVLTGHERAQQMEARS